MLFLRGFFLKAEASTLLSAPSYTPIRPMMLGLRKHSSMHGNAPIAAVLLLLLALPLVTSVADHGYETLVFAEVAVFSRNGESREWYVAVSRTKSLSLTLDEGETATVRVDSTSPLKPVRIASSGPSPCRAAIIEDVAVIYARGRCSLTIAFGAREPKPPIYMLKTGEVVEIKRGEPIKLSARGEWKPWGAFLRVLTLDGEPRIEADGPVSLLNKSLHKIATSIGEVKAEELVYLVLADNFTVKGKVLNAAFSPIYYKPLEGLGEENILAMSADTVLYINEPCFAEIRVERENATIHPFALLAKLLVSNPRIVSVGEGTKVSITLKGVTIKLPNRYVDFFVETEDGNRNLGEIKATPSLSGIMRVRVLAPWGDVVSEYEILSYAPEMEIPVTLYTLKVYLLDSEGEELEGADVVLYRALKVLTARANKSAVVFRDLPQGDYIIVVKYMGVEVARKLYSLEKDSRLTLRCNARPLKLHVTLADGTLPKEFEVRIEGLTYKDLVLEARGVNGSLATRPLPVGVYRLDILLGNVTRETFKADLSKKGAYLIALPLRPVTVKVLSALGVPLSGVKVSLESDGKEIVSTRTDDQGKAFFPYIEDGTYLVRAEVGSVRAFREVRVLGPDRIHVVLWLDVLALIWGVPITPSIAVITVAVVIAVVVAVAWRRRRRDIIILETRHRRAFDQLVSKRVEADISGFI